MTYTLCFSRHGSECSSGAISDDIWSYIQDECDGSASTYSDKLENGEVPEDLMLADGLPDFYMTDDIFYAAGPYADATVTVFEDEKEIAKFKSSEVESTTETIDASTKAKHYFVWESTEKGIWKTEIETDEPFDKSKLSLNTCCLKYNGLEIEIVSSIIYDGEECSFEPETEGISFELEFYGD